MKFSGYILLILAFAVLFTTSCTNTKFLTGDQMLYNGRTVKIVGDEKAKTNKKAEEIAGDVTYAEPNNGIMGRRILPPIGLWFHMYRKPGEGKRGGILYRTFQKEPVLVTNVNPDLRSRKIESDLFANGFFNAEASYSLDTVKNNQRKAKIDYSVKVAQPYRLAQILIQPAKDSIDTLINSYIPTLNLKPGNIFNLENIREEKRKLASVLVENGYYFFSPNEIEMIADTTQAPSQFNLLVRKKPDIQDYILKKYTINRIDVHVRKVKLYDQEATIHDTIFHDGVFISGETDYLRPEVITRATLFRPGELYSETKHRGTVPLLNNYGVFQSVKMQFSVTDSLKQKMNVLHELQPKNDITLNMEGAVQSKSTGFAGPVSEITLSHANLFKGANRLQLRLFGGFDWQWGKSSEDDLSSNSYNMGVNTSISFPKMIVPFQSVRENKSIIGKTIGTIGFEFKNHVKYYRMNSVNLGFGYQWRKSQKITHMFNPLRVNIVSLLKTTALFDSITKTNPYVKRSFEEQQIIGMEYVFTFDNSGRKRDGFYFQGMFSTSGNLIDAFSGIAGNKRPYTFLGNVYSQFIKTSADIRYYTNTTKEGLVLRVYAGTGISYGNSSVMPYVEQYFSGGSNSLRGFVARSLGPGSYKPLEYNGIIDQSGDIKLEFNSEFRFRMTNLMYGALFLETGNVWLLNTDVNRPGSQFKFNNFTRQLAVGTGAGLRFDFDFFVLRTDIGFPIRYPYNDGTGYWRSQVKEVINKFRFNLAIGYPF